MPETISYASIVSMILKQINKIRKTPQFLIEYLLERKQKYDKDGNYKPLSGLNFQVPTSQGAGGVQQLIDYLNKQPPSQPLRWSYQLHQAANKRCRYLNMEQDNQRNLIATMDVATLVNEFASCKGHLVELTLYGFIEPLELITELLLQDGHKIKENRQELFSSTNTSIGIGINTHDKYRFVVVIIIAMHANKKEEHQQRNSEQSISSGDEVVFCGPQCRIY